MPGCVGEGIVTVVVLVGAEELVVVGLLLPLNTNATVVPCVEFCIAICAISP